MTGGLRNVNIIKGGHRTTYALCGNLPATAAGVGAGNGCAVEWRM